MEYQCCRCGNSASEEHHVFFGWSGRALSERYNIKVPVCQYCHSWAHNIIDTKKGRTEEARRFFCSLMNIDYELINQYFNCYKFLDDEQLLYLDWIKNKLKNFKESYAI